MNRVENHTSSISYNNRSASNTAFLGAIMGQLFFNFRNRKAITIGMWLNAGGAYAYAKPTLDGGDSALMIQVGVKFGRQW